MQKNPKLK